MTEAQHQSADVVMKLVASLFDGRRFKDFKIEKVEFAYFPSAYNLTMNWEGRTLTLKIPSELVDEAIAERDLFKRRKIKRMIKDAFGMGHEHDDE